MDVGMQPPGDGSEGDAASSGEEGLEGDQAGGEGADGQGGETLDEGSVAGADPGSAGGDGSASGGPAGGEGLEGLDEQLDGSLEVFDRGMEGRRMVLASSLPAGGDQSGGGQRGDADGGGGDQTGEGPGLILGGEEGPAGEEGEGTRVVAGLPGTASPGNQPGDNQREGDFKSGGMGGRVPPDVGDGSDDDVVARQIREAAVNEADPALREKLWEEYRTYKSAAG